ncbi:hypothetical protein V8C42DRAFT_118901 [Trichoderma barbatum]
MVRTLCVLFLVHASTTRESQIVMLVPWTYSTALRSHEGCSIRHWFLSASTTRTPIRKWRAGAAHSLENLQQSLAPPTLVPASMESSMRICKGSCAYLSCSRRVVPQIPNAGWMRSVSRVGSVSNIVCLMQENVDAASDAAPCKLHVSGVCSPVRTVEFWRKSMGVIRTVVLMGSQTYVLFLYLMQYWSNEGV